MTRVLNRLLPVVAAGALLAGCVTAAQPMPKPEVKAAAMQTAAAVFARTDATIGQSADERAAVAAVQSFAADTDPKSRAALLSDGFQSRISVMPGKVSVVQRAAFLAADQGRYDHQLAVQSVAVSADGTEASATALATHKRTHFAPRFLETYNLTKTAGGWKIAQYIQVPLHPGKAELYDVSIIVTKKVKSEQTEMARLNTENPDAVIADWLSKPGNKDTGTEFSVFAVFKEPPPVGASVDMNTDLLPGTGLFMTIPIATKVAAETPFYVLGGFMEFRTPWYVGMKNHVVVNGTTIAENQF